MKNHIEQIKLEIDKIADKSKSEWWNNYLQHTILFIGVGIPDIRKIVKDWRSKYDENFELIWIADELMKLEIAEYKLAGILIYQEFVLQDTSYAEILNHINQLFEKKYIFDWNTCDWLCVRILSPVIDKGDKKVISTILDWHNKDYLWHARASLVPFAQCKTLPNHLERLNVPMATLISREERFAKSAVGWILREIYKFNPDFVLRFLKNHKDFLTREVLNNSLKYMDKEQRREFVSVELQN